ncbi:MAG: hypothetical protein FWF08_00140 [Oscillospiraceae bacterium]|nr:hypothetical protein [Oscillospiraceae bacterium]
MKKNILRVGAAVLAAIMLLTLAACGTEKTPPVINIIINGGGVAVDGGGAVVNTQPPVQTPTQTPPAASETTAPPASGESTTAGSGTPAATTTANQQDGAETPTTEPSAPVNTNEKSKAEILAIYTEVMNKAKTDQPKRSQKEYQTIPGDAANRQINASATIINQLLNLAGNFMTTEDQAEWENFDKGNDMRWFPVNKTAKGCLLTDANAIKEAKYEILPNGNAQVTIVLNDENNPEPPDDGATTSPSYHGAMFSPLSKNEIDAEILGNSLVTALLKDVDYSLVYHDCTAVLEFNPDTKQIVNLDHEMVVEITAKATALFVVKIDLVQQLYNNLKVKDFEY